MPAVTSRLRQGTVDRSTSAVGSLVSSYQVPGELPGIADVGHRGCPLQEVTTSPGTVARRAGTANAAQAP